MNIWQIDPDYYVPDPVHPVNDKEEKYTEKTLREKKEQEAREASREQWELKNGRWKKVGKK